MKSVFLPQLAEEEEAFKKSNSMRYKVYEIMLSLHIIQKVNDFLMCSKLYAIALLSFYFLKNKKKKKLDNQ